MHDSVRNTEMTYTLHNSKATLHRRNGTSHPQKNHIKIYYATVTRLSDMYKRNPKRLTLSFRLFRCKYIDIIVVKN